MHPFSVIGYEGTRLRDTQTLSWGTAAVFNGNQVVNSGSRRSCNYERFNQLADDGFVSRLTHPVNISEADFDESLTVLVVKADHPRLDLINRLAQSSEHFAGHGFQTLHVAYVFRGDLAGFNAFANTVIDAVLTEGPLAPGSEDELLSVTLNLEHPVCVAIRDAIIAELEGPSDAAVIL